MSGTSPTGEVDINRSHAERIIRFVGAGVVNTLFGYSVFAALVLIGTHPQVALIIQFIVGVIWNYQVHARYVFSVQGYNRLPVYAVSYVVIYAFNAVLLWALLRLGLDPYIAQAMALVPTVVLSYILISNALCAKRVRLPQ